MASNGVTNAVEIEQRKSYGIGGAGNISRLPFSPFIPLLHLFSSLLVERMETDTDTGRPSEVIYAQRTNPDGTRRRSSVWSSITTVSPSSSPEGKRTTLLNLFSRRESTGPAAGEGYKDVDYRSCGKEDIDTEH